MNLARVIGHVWATAKYPDLEGATFLLLQPLDRDLTPAGRPLAAADAVGAGRPGELVFYVSSYEAVLGYRRPMVPLDATVVGIVDRIDAPGTDRPRIDAEAELAP